MLRGTHPQAQVSVTGELQRTPDHGTALTVGDPQLRRAHHRLVQQTFGGVVAEVLRLVPGDGAGAGPSTWRSL